MSKAIRFLQDRAGPDDLGGSSLEQLAGLAGVSTTTMWKAVRALGADLQRSSGHRPDHGIRSGTRSPLWRDTASSIERDIITGAFPASGMLPSHKELQTTYGVSYRTLKKALTELVGKGSIVRRHKGYRVTLVDRDKERRSTVVVLLPRLPDGAVSWVLKGEELFHRVESACARFGITLHTHFYQVQPGSSQREPEPPPGLTDSWSTRGFLLFHPHHEVSLMQMLRSLAILRKPTVVVGHGYDERIVSLRSRGFPLFLVPIGAGGKPAEIVARHLLARGHTRIAYFSAFHASPWSRARLQALRQTYTTAGLGEGVKAYVLERNMEAEYASLREESMRRYHGHALLAFYEQWKKDVPPPFALQCDRSISDMVRRRFAFGRVAVELQPLFERAAEDTSITAWVMANDLHAAMALDWSTCTKSRAGRLPLPVSFDDTSLAVDHHITSFNFDLPSISNAVVGALLRPELMRRNYPHGTVEIDGFLVERT